MIGYVTWGMLVLPLVGLSTVKDAVESREPPVWIAFAWSVCLVALVAAAVSALTRRRIFWRS